MTKRQAACLAASLEIGYAILRGGGPAVLAIEQAIGCLEESALFNAGRGSKRQLDGVQRMDASIMEGGQLRAGAVASIESILHPITAARLVMDETDHVLLVGPLARRFVEHFELDRFREAISPRRLPHGRILAKRGHRSETYGTVGAVALDQSGTVAAGASTGGIDSMMPGRVGDTPLIGSGIYADNRSGAVSMTGIGEGIIRLAMAKTICDRLAQGTRPLAVARRALDELVSRIDGAAGTLVITPQGKFAITHVTHGMAAGWWDGTKKPIVRCRWQ